MNWKTHEYAIKVRRDSVFLMFLLRVNFSMLSVFLSFFHCFFIYGDRRKNLRTVEECIATHQGKWCSCREIVPSHGILQPARLDQLAEVSELVSLDSFKF